MVAYRRAYISLQGDERGLKRRLMEEVLQEPSRPNLVKPADSANESSSGENAGRGTRAAGDDGERGDRPSRPPGLTLTYEGPWP